MGKFPFQRLQLELAELIANTPGGERLPSEPSLAKQLGVSRATLREAMRTFETQGMIRRRQGAGTFVVGNIRVLESGLEVLESVETLAGRMNLPISVTDLHIDHIYADQETADMLAVPVASHLTCVERVICAEDRPVAFLVDILPEEYLDSEKLPADFNGSVLDYLIACNTPLTVSRTAISAVGASAEVARALQIQRGDVLLHFTAQLYVENGSIVDYSTSDFIPGHFNFHIMRRVGNLNSVINGHP